jgi:hypothetical protein
LNLSSLAKFLTYFRKSCALTKKIVVCQKGLLGVLWKEENISFNIKWMKFKLLLTERCEIFSLNLIKNMHKTCQKIKKLSIGIFLNCSQLLNIYHSIQFFYFLIILFLFFGFIFDGGCATIAKKIEKILIETLQKRSC